MTPVRLPANLPNAARRVLRVLGLVVLALWWIPQTAAYLGVVEMCVPECPDDDESGTPCPSSCTNCACANVVGRIAPPVLAVGPGLVTGQDQDPWWPRATAVTCTFPSQVFHPPKA